MKPHNLLKTAAISALLTGAWGLPAQAVFFHIGSGSIDGSLCVGNDCVSAESFGFDTIRLKENNLRIHFDDTSSTASFPPNDWRLYANDSSNGGSSYFGVEDATAGRFVFRVFAGARSNALTVDSQGDVGLGTTTPALDIDIKTGDTPSIRLQQDGTSGFTPQSWDMAGNETNFFVRDATGGSQLPFRIRTGADSDSLFIDTDNDIGMGTAAPADALDIRRTSGAVAMRLTNSTGAWRFNHNGTTGNLNIVRDGGTTPIKVDPTAVTNLLLVGINAIDQVDVTGNLDVSGTISVGGVQQHPDYVFAPDYELMPLYEVEKFVIANRHLPKIPSAADVEANGLNMTEMQLSLLEKVEELTLYTVQQQKIIDALLQRLDRMAD